jgi:FKBP-type peptidyl-prolyl cis-trans isomerase SlpA
MKKIETGDTVKVHYTGRLEDGTVFDTSLAEGREPLEVKLGESPLIQGFVDGLMDMTLGEKKTVEIESQNAYGDINENLISVVPKNQVPEGVQVGEGLQATAPNGTPINVLVTEVNEDTITVDANHPLAGKKLIFDLELVEFVETV